MAKIQVLSQAVADKIAAGEVAERPSAVVKELVENAIDAGASKIDVEIKKGGVGYIRVTDNGSGIPADQVETAFLRHATSKLTEIEDLYRIGTMGFRGEALASICAVAEVEVITKTADAEEGVYLTMTHGVPAAKEPIACPDGTTMVVKNLFANIPARMKFLKKDSTEAGYVADLLGRIALSRPDIAFSYTCDGKEIFATSGDGKLENVILQIYGLDHAKALLPVDYTEDHIHISGVVGKPQLSRGNRTRQTLFVNGRYVKNHVVAKVAEEAFRNTVMVGKFPFFVIRITLPAELVDVNVHPAKTEVKFANEKQIYDVAYHAVRNAIYAVEPQKTVEETTKPKTQQGEMPKSKAPERPVTPRQEPMRVTPKLVREYMESTIPKERQAVAFFREEPQKSPETVLEELLEEAAEKNKGINDKIDNIIEETPSQPQQEVMEEVVLSQIPRAELKVVGQVFDTYIVCQMGEEMFLIDQHAAHERMRFESLKESYLKQENFSQMLLSPMVLNLDHQEKQTVMEHLPRFLRFGFEIEDFGANAVIVHGSPIAGDEVVIRDLILELSDAMEAQTKRPVADFEERALDMISCKGAIKANKRLSYAEMQDLAQKVLDMEEERVATCPHGRPIRISFTKTEIEKLFKRKL
ncbi:MAG: DNA mismatch repair endonuclease MutL [Clostridia bacterium]|nr:DNA mismatch repair endonuclease MutL [Clostridia bacterium]